MLNLKDDNRVLMVANKKEELSEVDCNKPSVYRKKPLSSLRHVKETISKEKKSFSFGSNDKLEAQAPTELVCSHIIHVDFTEVSSIDIEEVTEATRSPESRRGMRDIMTLGKKKVSKSAVRAKAKIEKTNTSAQDITKEDMKSRKSGCKILLSEKRLPPNSNLTRNSSLSSIEAILARLSKNWGL